jgi:hypothetical protein
MCSRTIPTHRHRLARLLPYFLSFAAGFVVAVLLFSRREAEAPDPDWEAKYRDLSRRYRELAERIAIAESRPAARSGATSPETSSKERT